MTNRFKYNCIICGTEFLKWKYELSRKCCSQKCGNFYRRKRKIVQCKNCNKDFEKTIIEIKRSKQNFCSLSCYYKFNCGKNSAKFKGGSLNKNGYKVIYENKKRIFEHRYIYEKYLGRKLLKSEIIHHINEDKLDNRIENLVLTNRKKHVLHHNTLVKWSRKHEFCITCKSTEYYHEAHGLCFKCYRKRRWQKIQKTLTN